MFHSVSTIILLIIFVIKDKLSKRHQMPKQVILVPQNWRKNFLSANFLIYYFILLFWWSSSSSSCQIAIRELQAPSSPHFTVIYMFFQYRFISIIFSLCFSIFYPSSLSRSVISAFLMSMLLSLVFVMFFFWFFLP